MAGGGCLQQKNNTENRNIINKGERMNIARCKLDKRGRITLPLSFLRANNIYPENYDAVIQVVINNTNAIRIVFIEKGEEE